MRRIVTPVAALLLLSALSGCGRTLELPANAPLLLDTAGKSKDAADLAARLKRAGYSRIRCVEPDEPGGTWNPFASENLIQFWRIFTSPAAPTPDGARVFEIYRTPRYGRVLALDEPPALAALAFRGDALARTGNIRRAISAYEEARRQAPGLPLLHSRIGDCNSRIGLARAALTGYSRALNLAGPNPDLYEKSGQVLDILQRPREAEDCFEKAAGLDPDNPARWLALARVRQAHGKRGPALDAVKHALAVAPADAAARNLARTLEEKR